MPRIGSDYNILVAKQFLSSNRTEYASALEPLASGRRINRPSDDPGRLAEYFINMGRSSQLEQYNMNVNSARTKVAIADNTLSEMTELMNEAYSLALSGNNQTNTAEELTYITSRINDILEDLTGAANTKLGSEYIFSGYKTDTKPFTGDPVIYNGDNNIQAIKVSESKNVEVSIDPDETFLGGGVGVDLFDTLKQTIVAIQAGDEITLGALITDIQGGIDQLSGARAKLANSNKSLEVVETNLQNLLVQTSERISSISDVDIATATTELSFREYTLQASLAVTQRVLEIQLQSIFQ